MKQRFVCRFWARLLGSLLVSHELQRTSNLTYIWHILICIVLQPVQFSRMKGILVCFSHYPIDCRNCWSLMIMAPTPNILEGMEHYPILSLSRKYYYIMIDYPMFDGTTQGFLMLTFFSNQPTSVTARAAERRRLGGSWVYRTAAMSLLICWRACDVSNGVAVGWIAIIDPQDGLVFDDSIGALPIQNHPIPME